MPEFTEFPIPRKDVADANAAVKNALAISSTDIVDFVAAFEAETDPAALETVGTTIIGGDKTGNTRGSSALDIQSKRSFDSHVASSDNSVAVGQENTAGSPSGFGGAVAIGVFNTAGGSFSTAFGYGNSASGVQATAFGYSNLASGTESTAVGQYNRAEDNESTAVGRFNKAQSPRSTAVGRNNIVSQNGLRASTFGQHNRADGYRSSAFGYGNKTDFESASNATAFGFGNEADEFNSSAFGHDNKATENSSTAFGHKNKAFGFRSSAFGHGNNATENSSTAFGHNNTADGFRSSAFGFSNEVNGDRSLAVGYKAKTSVNDTVEIGYWPLSNTRAGAVRMHQNGQVAMTMADSANPPNDGGSTAGGEPDGTLGRNMFTIQKNGTSVTLYFNDGTNILSCPLGSLT